MWKRFHRENAFGVVVSEHFSFAEDFNECPNFGIFFSSQHDEVAAEIGEFLVQIVLGDHGGLDSVESLINSIKTLVNARGKRLDGFEYLVVCRFAVHTKVMVSK